MGEAAPILIGLHITKCAGTSLANQVQRQMPPKTWYLCSSFWQNQQQAILELPDRLNLNAVRFVFGHYVHESMLAVFKSRPLVLFTGVRDPTKRVISEYYHMCWILHGTGQKPLSANDFLKARSNTICHEILRAFPSAAAAVEGSLSDKAQAVLDLFGLIYESENVDETTAPLLRMLGLPKEQIARQNERRIDSASADYMAGQEAIIREKIPNAFAEDLRLYEAIRPKLGIWSGPGRPWAERTGHCPDWLKPVLEQDAAMERLQDHLYGFMARDFHNMGQRPALAEMIRRREAGLRALTEAARRLPPN